MKTRAEARDIIERWHVGRSDRCAANSAGFSCCLDGVNQRMITDRTAGLDELLDHLVAEGVILP